MNATHLPLLLLLAVVPLTLAGCASDPGESPTDEREDTKTFELRPGQSVEYKLQVSKGATLDYVWSTSRPVTFDFHGDTGGESYTSHKKGTAIADKQDGWAAPFDGRHGWYWKNNNAGPVTITLTTQGAYEVIGTV